LTFEKEVQEEFHIVRMPPHSLRRVQPPKPRVPPIYNFATSLPADSGWICARCTKRATIEISKIGRFCNACAPKPCEDCQEYEGYCECRRERLAYMFHPQNGRNDFAPAEPHETLHLAKVTVTPMLQALMEERLKELGGDTSALEAEFGFA